MIELGDCGEPTRNARRLQPGRVAHHLNQPRVIQTAHSIEIRQGGDIEHEFDVSSAL